MCEHNEHEHEKCHCHEHEHESCHCHEHDHEEECCCGHRHEDERACACGCGHDHGSDKGNKLKSILLYTLGAIPVIVGFVPFTSIPWLPMIAAIIGYALFGLSVYIDMFDGFLKKKIFTEFTLMCVATFGAFCIGEYADAAAVMYLYSLGERISSSAYSRSKRSIAELIEITPEFARVKRGGDIITVDPSDVAVGELVLVLAGERVPLDSVVVEGGGNADTSSITGESKPLELYSGVPCPSGAILSDGSVTLKVVKSYENSVVSELGEAVKTAQNRKSSAEKKISRFARVFTPAAFALATAIILVGGLLSGEWVQWVRAGLTVLVISCPCSLVLSVPLAYFAGLGAAAKRGVVFRGGEIMDALARMEAIAFDKTGTLTESGLTFDGVECFEDVAEKELLSLSKAVLLHSPHAAAVSFCNAMEDMPVSCEIADVEIIGGRGVVCNADGKCALFGNAALMREHGIDVADYPTTCIFASLDGKLLGRLDFSSHVKSGVKDAVADLRHAGISRICVFSGDGEASVASACAEADIEEFYFSLTPKEKLDKFEALYLEQKNDSKRSTVGFCGDGLNDSAVIARADVGIAMGLCGSALTVTSADVVIMDDDPSSVVEALKIARKTERVANVSIALSLGIKIAVMLVGVGFALLRLGEMPLSIAVVADVGAAIVSVLNAARAGR